MPQKKEWRYPLDTRYFTLYADEYLRELQPARQPTDEEKRHGIKPKRTYKYSYPLYGVWWHTFAKHKPDCKDLAIRLHKSKDGLISGVIEFTPDKCEQVDLYLHKHNLTELQYELQYCKDNFSLKKYRSKERKKLKNAEVYTQWQENYKDFVHNAVPQFPKLAQGLMGKVEIEIADGIHIFLPPDHTGLRYEEFEDFLHSHLTCTHPDFESWIDKTKRERMEGMFSVPIGIPTDLSLFFTKEENHFVVPRGFSLMQYVYPQLSKMGYSWDEKPRVKTYSAPLIYPKLKFDAHTYQEQALFHATRNPVSIIRLYCGEGKTFTNWKLAQIVQQRALFVVHTQALAQQSAESAQETFEEYSEAEEQHILDAVQKEYEQEVGTAIQVGTWHSKSKKKDKIIGHITVILIQSLIRIFERSREEFHAFMKPFGLVSVDEAYESGFGARRMMFTSFLPNKHLIFLDAEPARNSSLNRIQPKISRLIQVQNPGMLPKVITRCVRTQWSENEKTKKIQEYKVPPVESDRYRNYVIHKCCINYQRNKLIANLVLFVLNESRKNVVFVYTDRRIHMRLITAEIRKLKYRGNLLDVDFVDGGIRDEELEKSLKKIKEYKAWDFRDPAEALRRFVQKESRVLVTGKVGYIGLDRKDANVLIMCLSGNSLRFITQIIGRIERICIGKPYVFLYIITDPESEMMYWKEIMMLRSFIRKINERRDYGSVFMD